MTNESLPCGDTDARYRSYGTRFSLPAANKGPVKPAVLNGVVGQNRVMMEKTLKNDKSPSTVERILDSLKLSPKWRRSPTGNEKIDVENPIITTANSRSTSEHLSLDKRKHATISTSSSDCCPATETYDSFSDSTYSQSSETSVNSADRRSLNTTSTDSDNNRIFHQGISPRSRIISKGDTDVIDVDEGFLRRVLMLMKVVLYLRHSFPLNLIRRRRVYPAESARNHLSPHNSPSLSSSSMDSQDSSEFSGKSSRTRKRISFSPKTLLFSAITEKAFAEAKALLEEQDLDVNSQTPNGQSLLHIAAANADLKCIQLLLQYGADVNVKDSNGWTPLHAAVRRGNWKSAILMIEAGADFGEYAQTRIQEYNKVLQMSSTFYRSVEIFV
ncbi:cortactin-binding protein 2-like [Orbicella faveolata]|uniref:cortactin-binding protein 2-like n=1 Tax=Orbicella faveolata TaxID=48498 RepID=UPI0009E4938C|nr:cortactin-binding protein 2-like [Orbicella faveolata]